MKRWKKILIGLFLLIALSQLPFAYRRYRLGRLQRAIQQLNSERVLSQADSDFNEYKGVIHVHSFLGGHSTGSFEDILAAATANQLNFVVMTEHASSHFDTAAMTLKGLHEGVLFLNGSEVVTANQDRLLVVPSDEAAAGAGGSATQQFVSELKAKGALVLVAYPQELHSRDVKGYDGIEVYNVFTAAKRVNALVTFFDGLWSFRSYPDLMFANFHQRPDAGLKLWDEMIAGQNGRLVATASNDAHANLGLTLIDSTGKTVLGIKLDPYERSFRLVRMHVLIPKSRPLNADTLKSALGDGHCFIGFDLFADSTGFSFSAADGNERKIQGDESRMTNGTRLSVSAPVRGRVVLLKNGAVVREQSDTARVEFAVTEPGTYRVEVYLPQLPRPAGDQPWIISNPIYLR